MSEQLKESLSAAVDGEADEFELRRVVDEIGKDPELHDTWERYHIVRSVLSGHVTDQTIADRAALKSRVWEALDYDADGAVDDVDDLPASTDDKSGGWLRRSAAAAVVAAVALAVVLGSGVLDEEETQPAVAQVQVPDEPAALESTQSEADRRRSDAYMMHHVQHTALNSGGVIPFIKVVTYNEAEDSEQ